MMIRIVRLTNGGYRPAVAFSKKGAWPTMVLLLLCCGAAVAQRTTITGTVKDEQGVTLPGVSVSIKGTTNGQMTDANGKYSLPVSGGESILVFSSTGFIKQEVVPGSRAVVDVVLVAEQKALNEVVVVGYGRQKKASLTAAIATVKGKDIAEQPVGDLSNTLGGRAAGVIFTQGSGQAGNDAARIYIRGIGTNGDSQPLFIVDGIPRNYSQLNPSDIETISILKDAAAIAPYGMAGANGVILVTTKRGKTGKPVLTYDGYAGLQNTTLTTKFVSSYQYAQLKNAAALNEGKPQPYSADVLRKYQDGSDPDAYPNTNALEMILKKNTPQTSHSLSLSGGSDKAKYAMGLGYYFQDGALPKLNYKRYNLSANIDGEVTPSTTVSLSLNGRVEERNLTSNGFDFTNVFTDFAAYQPIQPLKFSNGLYTSTYANFYDNPSYQKITGNVLLTQVAVEQKLPVKGLSAKFVASYDFNPTDPFSGGSNMIQSFRRTWNAPYSYYNIDTTKRPYTYSKFVPTTLPSFSEEYHQAQAFTYQGYLNYTGNFGKHAVTGLIVLESRDVKASRFSAGRINYQVPIQELFAGSSAAADLSNDGTSSQSKQRSVVYRLTYGFNSKYLFEAAGRYDGHYYFAPGKRYGFFPAFSAAWRLSQEGFMKKVPWISDLKLKGSYGESGQLAGGPFQYLSAYTLYGNAAVMNNVLTQGLYENSEANPAITWERSKKTDIGFESNLWNGLLTVEGDYFYEKRNNMLITPNVTVPVEYGIGISQVNAGVMVNRGFELTVGSTYRVNQDLILSLTGNFTYAKNKLLQIFETSDTYNNPDRRQTGRPLGTQFGYQAIGYFTAADFDAAGNLKPGIPTQPWGKVYPGDIRYADRNGNGQIDVNDQTVIGNPTYPAIVYGFTPTITYDNFQLSLLFQGAAQRGIQLSADAAWAFFNGKSAPITALDYWTPDHPDAPNPRITSTPSQNNIQTSNWWQRNAAYLRLRTGMFSYNLPAGVLRHAGISAAKLYLSGQNLLTWTPLQNFDPELSNSRGGFFPTQKSVTIGLNVQF